MAEARADMIEQILQNELARGDLMIATARPVLRHLLANDDHFIFSDQVIARVRGMIGHIGQQMMFRVAETAQEDDRAQFAADHGSALNEALLAETGLLAHAHGLTLEAQLAQRLAERSGIDPVLSPLLQELVAAKDPAMSAGAMHVLASQARFMQQQRRMELPLQELPGDLFHTVSSHLQIIAAPYADAASEAERRLRAEYDEGSSRIGQIARLLIAMGRGAPRALAIDHAGVAIFSTALAMASGQGRDMTILSFGDQQFARLALALRAAGLKQGEVEGQFLFLHPDIALPDGFETIDPANAAQLLAASQPEAVI